MLREASSPQKRNRPSSISHSILGNKWSAITTHLPGRTDNEIKNFWNTHLKKKLIQMGFDPIMTHRPKTDVFQHFLAFQLWPTCATLLIIAHGTIILYTSALQNPTSTNLLNFSTLSTTPVCSKQ